MIGAYVGDCIGSSYEFPIGAHRDAAAPLVTQSARFTDDSVCTSAIAEWLLHGQADPAEALWQKGRLHMARGFGGKFLEWLRESTLAPYDSWGNGAAMRASPCALWARSDQEALDLARLSALPTHGHPDAVAGAQALALSIRRALEGASAAQICQEASSRFGYGEILGRDPRSESATHRFDVSCKGTVQLALAILNTSSCFEEAMGQCIGMGGDADTLAAICGPIAEGLWGVPLDLQLWAFGKSLPDDGVLAPILAIYGHPRVAPRLTGGAGAPLRWA